MKEQYIEDYKQRILSVLVHIQSHLEWLPFSGREVLAAPALEFYLNSPEETSTANLRTKICLPVAS